MGDKTGIQWTDATWNPIRGCSRVSEGCRHCYAETMAARFCDKGMPYYGLAKRTASGPRWTGEVRIIPEHLTDPLRWRKSRRIFTNSMSDLFHEGLTNEEIAAIFGIMAACPHHQFQVLTKRAKRMAEWFEWLRLDSAGSDQAWDVRPLTCWRHAKTVLPAIEHSVWDKELYEVAHKIKWPLPNVWLGVSVENQEAADERIPYLLKVPAAIRFLSCEPLIDRVSLMEWLFDPTGNFRTHKGRRQFENVAKDGHGLHWVIAGCESGADARPCEPGWLRTLRDECRGAGVKYFLKQATAAQEGGHRLYPSGQAARSEVVDVVKAGDGSKMKPGGVIGLPYLDNVQHADFPA